MRMEGCVFLTLCSWRDFHGKAFTKILQSLRTEILMASPPQWGDLPQNCIASERCSGEFPQIATVFSPIPLQ